jgi:hypothetical protein
MSLNDQVLFSIPEEPIEVYMEDLWRFGIPIALRKTLWPFKIQNKLGISKQLYRLNREHGLRLLKKAEQSHSARFPNEYNKNTR